MSDGSKLDVIIRLVLLRKSFVGPWCICLDSK